MSISIGLVQSDHRFRSSQRWPRIESMAVTVRDWQFSLANYQIHGNFCQNLEFVRSESPFSELGSPQITPSQVLYHPPKPSSMSPNLTPSASTISLQSPHRHNNPLLFHSFSLIDLSSKFEPFRVLPVSPGIANLRFFTLRQSIRSNCFRFGGQVL